MKFLSLSICLLLFLASPLLNDVFAHVAVKPQEVSIGSFQTFVLSAPSEKEQPTIGIRLVLPDGLNHVTPTVKSGWNIEVKKQGEGESAKVTEILWTGGEIPAGQRDEFSFSAQVPVKTATLRWKVYQTYLDGTVLSWDKEEQKNDDAHDTGPYSTTLVVDDLQPSITSQVITKEPLSQETVVSLIALAIALIALIKSRKREK